MTCSGTPLDMNPPACGSWDADWLAVCSCRPWALSRQVWRTATRGQRGPMNWQWYPDAEVLVSQQLLYAWGGQNAPRAHPLPGFAERWGQKTSLKSDVATKLFHLSQDCVISEEDLQLKIKPLTGRNSHLLGREHQKTPK